MTVLRNNFDGGPDGTTVTVANSGQVPGNDAFNAVSSPASGQVMQFAATEALERPTAEFVLHVATGSTSVSAGVQWNTSMGTQTQVWWRAYSYYVALPTTTNPPVFVSDNGTAYGGITDVDTNAHVRLINGPSTASDVSAVTVPLGAWFRVEGWYQFSTTSGNGEVRIYITEPDGVNPDETLNLSNVNMGTSNCTAYTFGYAIGRANLPHAYVSGIEVNNTGWPGPAPFRPGKGVPGILTNPIAIHTDAS